MFASRIRTAPASGESTRASNRSSVDFPDPDGPAITVMRPPAKEASSPRSARTSSVPV